MHTEFVDGKNNRYWTNAINVKQKVFGRIYATYFSSTASVYVNGEDMMNYE
jgi:hypothetical protein